MTTPTRVELTPQGTRLTSGALAARRIGGEPGRTRVALVATEALLLAGDEMRISVEVSGPVALELVETAGTVAYDMRGGAARWDVDITLTDGAELTWFGEPFVVAAGADVRRATQVRMDADCRLTLRESIVLGRTGEVGGDLRMSSHFSYAGVPALVEELDLSTTGRSGQAVLGGHRCLDSVTTLGHRLADDPTEGEAGGSAREIDVLQLAAEGSVARWIGDAQHESTVAALR